MRATLIVLGVLGAALLVLTAFGLTGSSMQLADDFPGIRTGMQPLLGTPSAYRGDEWGVITPAAMAQTTHKPAFPVINTNMGVTGINMLLVHMTGVPVGHVVSLVKPPVWGFFALDMRHALAWYWWTPLFMGFAGVFVLMQTLWRGQWAVNAGASAVFAFSMHSVAFSFWPAYVASYFCLFAAAVISLRRSPKLLQRCLWAAGAAWAFSGGVMTLYAPWIVPALSLALVLLLAVALREKAHVPVGWKTRLVPALVFAACAAGVLAPWYADVQEALRVILASSYPGGRLSQGGDWPLWGLAKGWVSLTTFYADPAALMMTGQGYNLYPLLAVPLCALYGRRIWGKPLSFVRAEAEIPALILLLAATLWYQYVGFPAFLARWTLWTRTHGFGADVLVGLTQALLLAGLYNVCRSASAEASPCPAFSPRAAWGLTAACALPVLGLSFAVPHTPSLVYGFLAVAAVCLLAGLSYGLLRGAVGRVTGALAALTLLVALPFHPLSLASTGIVVEGALASAGTEAGGQTEATAEPPLRNGGRTALSGSGSLPPNFVRASGIPTLNGVLFYADTALQSRFYDQLPDAYKFYKYNHLHIGVTELPAPATFQASAGPDSNQLVFDLHRFNFNDAFVDFVVMPKGVAPLAADNPSLRREHEAEGFVRFRVVPVLP